MKSIFKNGLVNALLTAAYVALIAAFMFYMGTISQGDDRTILTPISFLLLFVFSAALTGGLIFGKPVMWYLDGKKKEALLLLVCTLGIFLLMTIVVLFFLLSVI